MSDSNWDESANRPAQEPEDDSPARKDVERRREAEPPARRRPVEEFPIDRKPARPREAEPAGRVREDMVQNAVKFLTHPSVRDSTVEKQVSFLRERKKMTKEEIKEAFDRAGLPPPTFSSSPAQSSSSREVSREVDGGTPQYAQPYRAPYSQPPQYQQNQPYPPPPYAPYPPQPIVQMPAPPPVQTGFGYQALLLTGLVSAGLAAGATYFGKQYFTPPRPPKELEQKPDGTDVVKKQRDEIVSEVSESFKKQMTALNDTIGTLQSSLKQTADSREAELRDLKLELQTMKTRMKDIQTNAMLGLSQPPPSIPLWQQKRHPAAPAEVPSASPASSLPSSSSISTSSPPNPGNANASTAVPVTVSSPASTPATSSASSSPSSSTPLTNATTGGLEKEAAASASAPPKPATSINSPVSSPASTSSPAPPPYSSSFQAITEMVQRGETPPDVQDIDDRPVPPPEGIAYRGEREAPPKPWLKLMNSPAAGGSAGGNAPLSSS